MSLGRLESNTLKVNFSVNGWYFLVVSGFLVLIVLVAPYLGLPSLFAKQTTYRVVFFQTPTCGTLKEYAIPWGVKIGNTTVTQPPGASLPQGSNRALYGIPQAVSPLLNQTRITFYVPNGEYQYVLMPSGDFYDPVTKSGGNLSGTIRVDGHTVSINVTVANPGNCGF